MRRFILLAALIGCALSAFAAKRLTVAQLEQSLDREFAAHRSDLDLARKIGELELGERLTPASLDRMASRFALGPRTALALQLLADQSALLDPPAAELPAAQPPDAAVQQQMMDRARRFVVDNWPWLPNFFVTRTTHRFDDGAQVLRQGDWPVRAGLHLVATASRQVTFRDGKETQDETAVQTASANRVGQAAGQATGQETGLTTWGEFGPELAIVLADAAKGHVAFSHWEQTPAGLAAVFRYAVPRAASHYSVSYCCIRDEKFLERRDLTFRSQNQTPQEMANLPRTVDAQTFRDTPGYHGMLFVDPATGAVLRITLEAELKESDPINRASTVVEYGSVKIGDRGFICPVRSLAISMEPPAYNANGEPRSPSVLLLNETEFTNYHRLGSTMRVVTNAAAGEGSSADAARQPGAPDASPPAPAATSTEQAGTTAKSAAEPEAPAEQPTAAPGPPPAPPAAAGEFALSDGGNLPERAAGETRATSPAATGPDTAGQATTLPAATFKVTSRLVDVGIVIYDKKGHPVRNLKQEDFEVYDNGRKQEIRFFSQPGSETESKFGGQPDASASSPAPRPPPNSQLSFSNRPADPVAADPASAPHEAAGTVLLIDASHIAWPDLSNARQQVMKFLKAAAPGERIGLYSMNERGFKVLVEITDNHAVLIDRLQKWMPTAQSVSNAQEEEKRNRQQFNEVHNVADLNSVNGNRVEEPDSGTPIDPQLLTMGDNPGRAALVILAGVARHLAAMPGRKSLVWISSDNVFAEWQDQAVAIDKSPKDIRSFALRAQEAMNDAHAAVYPFDVSQLEGAAISADTQHRNVELTPAAMDAASLAPGGAGAVPRNMGAGRTSAEMSQDMHPIQGPIRQVAEATGGRTIRRAGDMAAELGAVTADAHAGYLVSFRPQTSADNQYHNITVKLLAKKGLTARYRTGYFFAKEPETLRERFQQAVWSPIDANELSLSARVEIANPEANLKLSVAAGDLGMEQLDGRWLDRLDVFFVQRDDAGVHAQVEGKVLALRLKPETYREALANGVPIEHGVRLKPGIGSLRVVVVDESSGRMGSVTIPAETLSGSKPSTAE